MKAAQKLIGALTIGREVAGQGVAVEEVKIDK